MEFPKISIVTPSFNTDKFIGRTIESVIEQNYTNIEHIIIDGGSSDSTLNILKNYKHLKWISEKDSGQSNAINKGLKIANGEIIGWINSDDFYNKNALNTVVEYFDKNEEVDLIYSDVIIVDENGGKIGISKGEQFNLIKILTYNMVKQPSLFFRKRVIDKIGYLNESLNFVMDQEYWLRAGLANLKFLYIPHELFASFRLISGTKSFDKATSFNLEWTGVVNVYLESSSLRTLSDFKRKRILRKLRLSEPISELINGIETKNRNKVFSSALLSIKKDFSIALNLGFWKLVLKGLFGLKFDKLNKFR